MTNTTTTAYSSNNKQIRPRNNSLRNEKKLSELKEKEAIEPNGMAPIVPVSDAMAFEYPANDFHPLYESLMVQLNDQSNDYDDIVPEFNEILSALNKKQEDNHKVDFQREKYEE